MDAPKKGKVYRITGTKDDKAIANGNTWAESEITVGYFNAKRRLQELRAISTRRYMTDEEHKEMREVFAIVEKGDPNA